MKNNKRGFGVVFILIILVLIFGGLYLIQRNGLEDNTTSSAGDNSIVGLWKADSNYKYIDETNTLKSAKLTTPLYTQFTADNKFCDQWNGDYSKCLNYATYIQKGSYIIVNQENVTGPEWRYSLRFIDKDKVGVSTEYNTPKGWLVGYDYIYTRVK